MLKIKVSFFLITKCLTERKKGDSGCILLSPYQAEKLMSFFEVKLFASFLLCVSFFLPREDREKQSLFQDQPVARFG